MFNCKEAFVTNMMTLWNIQKDLLTAKEDQDLWRRQKEKASDEDNQKRARECWREERSYRKDVELHEERRENHIKAMGLEHVDLAQLLNRARNITRTYIVYNHTQEKRTQ
jgi:hypothetical protein